jgi:phage terminase small subunit
MALTTKEQRFVAEYLIDMNATQAAIRAGYSKHTARQIASTLLSKVDIAAEVASGMDAVAKTLSITAERVIAEIAAIAFGDIRGIYDNGRLMMPEEWDEATAAAIAGIEFETVSKGGGAVEHIAKIKRADKLRALDMLARHLALYNDKIDVNVHDGMAERVARAKARGAT